MTSTAYQLIDTPEAVQAWLADLEGAPCLAVDFEADGLFSYREKLCLIQVTDRDSHRIIDPLAVPEMLAGFAQTRSEIAAARADLIKWMFVFVATATLAILGLG